MSSNARSLVLIGVFSAVAQSTAMAWLPGKEIAQRMMMRHVNAWRAGNYQAVTALRTFEQGFKQGWDAATPKSCSSSESSDSKRAQPLYQATLPLVSHAGGDDNVAVKPCPCGTAKVPRTIVIESPKQSGGRARQQQRQQQWCTCECHRQSGVCTYWDDRRGFGFIEIDAATAEHSQALEHYRRHAEGNLFVHYSDIKHIRGHRSLYVGEALEFQLARHKHSRKYKAMNVRSVPLIEGDDLEALVNELTGSSPRT